LKSYTGFFDIFSECIQNALDAIEKKQRVVPDTYKGKLWITLDLQNNKFRVVDNGVGMDLDELKFCLRPNVSFKVGENLRGNKGVGATFLAYGYSFIRIQTKQAGASYAAVLRQGRQWAEDQSNTIPRPTFEAIAFDVPELISQPSGTAVEIMLGQHPGERPKSLSWLGVQTAKQWIDVLRVKTPLGGVYLSTPPFKTDVTLNVVGSGSPDTTEVCDGVEYYFPHEATDFKVQSISDLASALNKIQGDLKTKQAKLPAEFTKLDCIYEIWTKDEIIAEDSDFQSILVDGQNKELAERRELLERHQVCVYIAFLRSSKLWSTINHELIGVRGNVRLIYGGLQMASDFMVQGDLAVIPLTSAIGYQANAHCIVHFRDGNPDMGRKVFQPELKELAEALAVRAVTVMRRYQGFLKPDVGNVNVSSGRKLHDWKKIQEDYRDKNPLSFQNDGRELAIISTPQQEQDVIALYHELIGLGVIKGVKFFSTSQHETYDSLVLLEYGTVDEFAFSSKASLGVSRDLLPGYLSEPLVLEYKHDLDDLISDFESETKFDTQINFVVCWSTGSRYKERFYLRPLLIGSEGSNRTVFGATHQAFLLGGGQQPAFEVIVLRDLLRYLSNPKEEEARQKSMYSD
jgi:hypothetical protein